MALTRRSLDDRGGWPHAELDRVKDDLETHFYEMLDLVPEVAERVRNAKREAPFAGVPTQPLPQTVRSRLGALGRRWLLERSDHSSGHQ
jgi:hypothetical protein